ncbi:MAG TPA: hypothetical protein VL048_05610 [Xanthobacteraceae bacterium]|nr:hypothetical protein [Xanthobacteraceae bacterium]
MTLWIYIRRAVKARSRLKAQSASPSVSPPQQRRFGHFASRDLVIERMARHHRRIHRFEPFIPVSLPRNAVDQPRSAPDVIDNTFDAFRIKC